MTTKLLKKGSSSNLEEVLFASGTSEGTGADQSIAHGLSSTPNLISIVPTTSGTIVTSLYADGTNIHVTVTSGKAFGWTALVV